MNLSTTFQSTLLQINKYSTQLLNLVHLTGQMQVEYSVVPHDFQINKMLRKVAQPSNPG